MSDEDVQAAGEATNPDESLDLDLNLGGDEPKAEETPEEPAKEELVPKSQFQQALARAKKAEEALKKRESATLPEKDDDIHKTVAELKFAETKRQFGYEHGLSPDETDVVFRFSPKPTKEDLEHPFVKGGLEALRAKRRVESNTPSPSSKIFKVGGKQWHELSSQEKEANWAKRQEFFKGKN